jgi:hypothetical protein
LSPLPNNKKYKEAFQPIVKLLPSQLQEEIDEKISMMEKVFPFAEVAINGDISVVKSSKRQSKLWSL